MYENAQLQVRDSNDYGRISSAAEVDLNAHTHQRLTPAVTYVRTEGARVCLWSEAVLLSAPRKFSSTSAHSPLLHSETGARGLYLIPGQPSQGPACELAQGDKLCASEVRALFLLLGNLTAGEAETGREAEAH